MPVDFWRIVNFWWDILLFSFQCNLADRFVVGCSGTKIIITLVCINYAANYFSVFYTYLSPRHTYCLAIKTKGMILKKWFNTLHFFKLCNNVRFFCLENVTCFEIASSASGYYCH